MSLLLPYEKLREALHRLGYSQLPAEYHGAMCGAMCVRDARDIDPLRLLDAAESAAEDAGAAEQTLRTLCEQCADALESHQLEFTPLLPDDAKPLDARVQALSAWCEGFLFGLAVGPPLNMKQCSPEFKEILKDFTEFTRAGFVGGEDAELEETAYAELVEYVRVGVQLVYLELHGQPQGSSHRPNTVH